MNEGDGELKAGEKPVLLSLFRGGGQEAATGGVHERATSFRQVSVGSDRKFGLTVGGLLAVVALWPWIARHREPRIWLLVLAGALILAGLVAPRLLAPLNKAWFAFGLFLSKIVNPVIMGVLFFLVIVPIGWFVRRRGHDLLRLKRDASADSYWIPTNRDAAPGALTKQF
jgi:hypothetical protein